MKRLALILSLTLFGCGDNILCGAPPDGYYKSPMVSVGYTFQNGLPLGLQGYTCKQAPDLCEEFFVCSEDSSVITVTVKRITEGEIELKFDPGSPMLLYKE